MTAPDPAPRWPALAAAEVLAGRREGRPPAAIPSPRGAVEAVVEAVGAHRLLALIAPHARDLGASTELAEGLARAHRRSQRRGLAVAADTARVSALLHEAGLPHLVCKGAALDAALDHAPGTRGAGDVDVWVAERAVADAARVLTDAGWPRRASLDHYPTPDDGAAWRLLLWGGKELPFDNPTATSVDLHWRLTNGRRHLSFGFQEAMAQRVLVDIGATTVPTLDPSHALEHMAAHGRKEAWPYLRQLVDIVELAALVGDADTGELAAKRREVAAALGVAAFLAPWLRDRVRLDRRTGRQCADAWRGCLELDRRYHVRMDLTGTAAWRASLRHEWWIARSAPDWRSRFGYPTRLVLWGAVHAPRRRRSCPPPTNGIG